MVFLEESLAAQVYVPILLLLFICYLIFSKVCMRNFESFRIFNEKEEPYIHTYVSERGLHGVKWILLREEFICYGNRKYNFTKAILYHSAIIFFCKEDLAGFTYLKLS